MFASVIHPQSQRSHKSSSLKDLRSQTVSQWRRARLLAVAFCAMTPCFHKCCVMNPKRFMQTFHELSCDTGLKLEGGIHDCRVLATKISDICGSSRIPDKGKHHRIRRFPRLFLHCLLQLCPCSPLRRHTQKSNNVRSTTDKSNGL